MPVVIKSNASSSFDFKGNNELAHLLQQAMQAAGWILQGSAYNYATSTFNTVNAFAGTEVYKIADSLAATAPIYVEIKWGYGSSIATARAEFRFGTTWDATNGLGNAFANHKFGYRISNNSNGNFVVGNAYAGGFLVHACSDYDGFFCFSRASLADGTVLPDIILASAGNTGYANEITTNSSINSAAYGIPHHYIAHPTTINGMDGGWKSPQFNWCGSVQSDLKDKDGNYAEMGFYPHVRGVRGGSSRLFRALPRQHAAGGATYLLDVANEGQKRFTVRPFDYNAYTEASGLPWRLAYAIE